MIRNILLTADTTISNADILTWTLSGIVLILIFIFIYKEKNNKKSTEALDKFLERIQGVVKEHIIEFIDKFDISTYKDDFLVMQADLLTGLYDDIYNLCIDELQKIYGEDSVTVILIKKTLTREKIEEYVTILLEDNTIKDKLTNLVNSLVEEENKRIESEDEKLAKEAESYEEDDDDHVTSRITELDPNVVVDPERTIVEEKINPPKEEESESVSVDDETVEILN